LGRFAYHADDYDFYPLADGYVSYRAWVRGKVASFLSSDPKADRKTAARKAVEARRYFDLARGVLTQRRRKPVLLGVGGVIGSGKTTVAEGLARALSAPLVSADATRKFLAGICHEALGDERIYRQVFTSRMQEEILRRA